MYKNRKKFRSVDKFGRLVPGSDLVKLLFFMNISHMSSVRITNVKDSCESFTEVKDSHVFVTSEKFVLVLHRGQG